MTKVSKSGTPGEKDTAVQISNIAAGIEVEKFGASPVSIAEIINKINVHERLHSSKIRNIKSLENELQWHRKQGKKIVFTNGCFDILHYGHIECLKFCKKSGDIVIVGLNSDSSIRRIKGVDRPINNQNERASVLCALENVDYVVVFDEDNPFDLISQIVPDILIKGEDWAKKEIIGEQFVESHGGKVLRAPLIKGLSSTAVIKKIQSTYNASNVQIP